MATSVHITRRIPPRQCDAQGMLHASRVAEHVEDACLAWLDEACDGYGVLRALGVDLVMVTSSTTYRGPAHLDDVVRITVEPSGRGRTSVQLRFDLSRDGTVLVTTTNTYVVVGEDGPQPIPELLDRALEGTPAIERDEASEV